MREPRTRWAALERPYRDRAHAGEVLAGELERYRNEQDIVVLALPRGGVPVAAVVASTLGAELDVLSVRKLGVPGQEELAMGALASGEVCVMNPELVKRLRIPQTAMLQEISKQSAELARREAAFRRVRPPARVTGRTVILVDDGIATGATMHAAVTAIRSRHPRKLIVATPVAASAALMELRRDADDVICPLSPDDFEAVGQFYADFSQVTTEFAVELLELASRGAHSKAASRARASSTRPNVGAGTEIELPVPGATLRATLTLPADARGLIVFAHGSGSSRFSARNGFVARVLESRKLGTLLVDLLTTAEDASDRAVSLRFDIDLLSERVVGVLDWARGYMSTRKLPLGLFGSSTGAAGALAAAAERPGLVRAVVSRGGRADLAGKSLRFVRAPTLLIVGGDDREVLVLNETAAEELRTEHRLEIVPGAGHLFEEPGALEAVANLAAEFFETHLVAVPHST